MAIPTATTLSYNPNNPVYVAPETQQTTTNLATLPTDASYVDPEKATVAGQLKGILTSGNPLLESVRAKSDQAYNSRGLLQSQGGVRAGTAAMIDTATPIAAADAGLFGDLAKSSQKANQDAALNNQIADIEYKKSKNNALITGALTQQETAGKVELQKLADNAQMQRLEIDNQWKDMFNMDQMDTEESKALMNVAGGLGQELTGGIERLLRDTNITDKTAAVEALMTQYRSQLTTAAAIVNIPLSWS
jgi:hypothetical protein